jgi:capsule polysaccharide export protein KpsE/RkpR
MKFMRNKVVNTTKCNRFKLINYTDVLGNKEDGYEINNQCIEFDDLYIDNNATNKEVLTFLKSIKFLTSDDMRKLIVENSGDLIEIYQKKDYYPLCALHMIY